MATAKTESHYKILGTTAKIGQGRIKEKYIEAVKKHPPELDPEMFEKIRSAYETLKDPAKRRQYDLFRKYGNKVEDLIEKAAIHLAKGDFVTAQELYEKALTLSPNNLPSVFGLIEIVLFKDDVQTSRKYFEQTLEHYTNDDEQSALYSIYGQILYGMEYLEEALEILEEGKGAFPDNTLTLDIGRAVVYTELDEMEKAWNIFNEAAKNQDVQGMEYLELYLGWARILVSTEKWERKEILQKQFRKFIKQQVDEEDRQEVFELMMDEYEMLLEHHQFLGAEMFIDFAKILSNNDKDVREKHQEVKKMAQVEKDIRRLEQDNQAFPLLFFRTFEWFYVEHDGFIHALNEIPKEVLASFENAKEEYAAGILYLRKKYPLLYKVFKKQWDNEFTELTEGFNREMKRALNKMK